MPHSTDVPLTPAGNASEALATRDRERLRAAGLRPIEIWVPDVQAPGFAEACRAQAAAIAADDPAGEEALCFIEATYRWPEP